jgi:predicted AlkP superfamily pyrophosphatase or phosphodiesterase
LFAKHATLGAAVVAVVAVVATLGSTPVASPAATTPDGPALVVLLVVDQMRADYVTRYGRHWQHGLARLAREGARFDRAAFPYLNTTTCVGHATIGTGRFPSRHGIVRNSWYDRSAGRVVDSTDDPDALPGKDRRTGGETPCRLLAPTLAERMKQGGGRSVALSLKACAAIGLAGHEADAVLWFGGCGSFVSSAAYGSIVPRFAVDTIARRPIERDRGETWVKVLPGGAYAGEDAALGERPPAGWSDRFPHSLDAGSLELFAQRWMRSPYADAYLGLLARAAVEALDLGKDERPDFLGVSFSALDLIGHAFGPESHEVQDALARIDRTIGALIDYLDTAVGLRRYVLALTSDHGVAPIPEQLLAKGIDAGRLSLATLRDAVEGALVTHLGAGPHVAAVAGTEVYLHPGAATRLDATGPAFEAVRAAVVNVPGVARVFHRDELTVARGGDRERRAAALSYVPGRSGDLVVIPRKHWIATDVATTHGTSYDYDQRVPLILFGAGIRPGHHSERVTPADIVPTLALLAGLALPGTDGRPLARALDARRPGSSSRP